MPSNFDLDLDLDLPNAQGQANDVRDELVAEVHGSLHVGDSNGLRSQNILAEAGSYREILDLPDLLGVQLMLLGKHLVRRDQGIFSVPLMNGDERCEVSGLL
jgi:hypothetical protein